MNDTEQEKIMTLNLDNKQGVHILKRRYDVMKGSILNILNSKDEIALSDLRAQVEVDLAEKFDGRVGWYLMAVKLDLEARKIIEKVPNKKPQMLRIMK